MKPWSLLQNENSFFKIFIKYLEHVPKEHFFAEKRSRRHHHHTKKPNTYIIRQQYYNHYISETRKKCPLRYD